MNIKKDDSYSIMIEDLSADGSGIGRIDGYTVFVKDALPGDLAEIKIIKAKKTYGYGRLMKVLTPSPDRAQPLCPAARRCGGCQIQALSYPAQLRFKENKVRELLTRIGKITDYTMLPIIGMDDPWYYRNKAQSPVGTDHQGSPVTGFYAGRTHSIIPVENCYIQSKYTENVLPAVLKWMKENHIPAYNEKTGRGLVRHILTRAGFHTGQIMVCLVINGHKLPAADALIESLTKIPGMASISFSPNTARTNVILGDSVQMLWGEPYITDSIGDVSFHISPLSFYQVNPVQTEKLYRTALGFASPGPDDVIWDLYCGIGTISLFMARKAAHVFGVEIIPQAIENARENACLNGITNTEFYVGKAEEILPAAYEKNRMKADIIVVDPPRKGCDKSLLDCIITMQPRKVVYVSCDPATLARDLCILEDGGFKVDKVQCVDMFPHSVHVETVVLMSRKDT